MNKENRTEPLGVLILERCTVELDLKDDIENSFLLVYEGEDHPYHFACLTEEERDGWIQALHIASYECLKMQLQSLREQLQAKTGRDPIQLPPQPQSSLDLASQSDTNSDAVMEISISCIDLPTDSSGQPPNPLVVVHTITPPDQQLWVNHNHTEVVEKCYNPQFLKTIGFGDKDGVDTATRVRLTVYHVVERMTGTMSQIGQAVFSLQDVLMTNDTSLTLTLQSHDLRDCGKIKIMAWVNDDNTSLIDIQGEQNPETIVDNMRSKSKSLSKQRDNLKPYFDNIITKTFRFATNNDSNVLQVQENMGESKWTFDIPAKLLKLWIDEEKQRISLLQDLGELSAEWSSVQQEMTDFCMSVVTTYTQNISYLTAYEGPSFKPSCEKDNKELEFIPTNLHIQRMTVASEGSNKGKVYDVVTHGAFTAFVQKFKGGGLRRLLQYQKDFYSAQSTLGFRTKMQQACSLLNEISNLKQEINIQCEKLCYAALQGQHDLLDEEMKSLTETVKELVRLCEDPILQLSAEKYMQAKSPSNSGDGLDLAASLGHSNNKKMGNLREKSPEKSWRWSGSNFVKSPTVEPWEVTRLNLEAAIVCLISKVEDLVSNQTDPTDLSKWLSELSPAVIKLQSFVEIVSSRATLFLTFLSLMENKDHVKLMHMIKNRRDVVTAHAVTTLVAGIVVNIQTNQHDDRYLEQLAKVGLLAEFESLLSCYGEELGMLEDLAVAVDDLASVSFRFSEAKENNYEPVIAARNEIKGGMFPDINRHTISVTIPVSSTTYSLLPSSLRQGGNVKVTPVLFNIGINEQATLAEKFGNTNLQERVNAESVAKIFTYFETYVDIFGKTEEKQSAGPGSLSQLTKQLHTNVMTKKNKNVEVLHLAAEICRKLKGVRFTCCKSGKDRTSMAVTLEQVQVLQQEHDLASHVFWQSLDCLRTVGCRRENTLKNTGVKKYAFNSLQMLYIPKLYRAPNGTYGNTQT